MGKAHSISNIPGAHADPHKLWLLLVEVCMQTHAPVLTSPCTRVYTVRFVTKQLKRYHLEKDSPETRKHGHRQISKMGGVDLSKNWQNYHGPLGKQPCFNHHIL